MTLKAETLRALAETRVRQYLDERRLMRGLDFQQIHGLHTGTDRECELLASDLRVLLEADKDERRKVIEECAAVCDDHARTWGLAMASPAIVLANAIRELKGPSA